MRKVFLKKTKLSNGDIKIILIRPYGIASGYSPKIKAAFVRRKEKYGMA